VAKIYHPQAVLYSDDGSFHAFIRLNGKFYDSDRPIQGATDWRKLRTYNDVTIVDKLTITRRQPKNFFDYWNFNDEFAFKVRTLHNRSTSRTFRQQLKKFTALHVPGF
jgi:hypothetical protein